MNQSSRRTVLVMFLLLLIGSVVAVTLFGEDLEEQVSERPAAPDMPERSMPLPMQNSAEVQEVADRSNLVDADLATEEVGADGGGVEESKVGIVDLLRQICAARIDTSAGRVRDSDVGKRAEQALFEFQEQGLVALTDGIWSSTQGEGPLAEEFGRVMPAWALSLTLARFPEGMDRKVEFASRLLESLRNKWSEGISDSDADRDALLLRLNLIRALPFRLLPASDMVLVRTVVVMLEHGQVELIGPISATAKSHQALALSNGGVGATEDEVSRLAEASSVWLSGFWHLVGMLEQARRTAALMGLKPMADAITSDSRYPESLISQIVALYGDKKSGVFRITDGILLEGWRANKLIDATREHIIANGLDPQDLGAILDAAMERMDGNFILGPLSQVVWDYIRRGIPRGEGRRSEVLQLLSDLAVECSLHEPGSVRSRFFIASIRHVLNALHAGPASASRQIVGYSRHEFESALAAVGASGGMPRLRGAVMWPLDPQTGVSSDAVGVLHYVSLVTAQPLIPLVYTRLQDACKAINWVTSELAQFSSTSHPGAVACASLPRTLALLTGIFPPTEFRVSIEECRDLVCASLYVLLEDLAAEESPVDGDVARPPTASIVAVDLLTSCLVVIREAVIQRSSYIREDSSNATDVRDLVVRALESSGVTPSGTSGEVHESDPMKKRTAELFREVFSR